jgi:Ca2+/H+ antiporter
LNEQKAFEISVQQIGQAKPLKTEFKKIDAENWNRPLALAAWISFVVSFFLPAYGDGQGWRCAGLSATVVSWPEFWHGNWPTIHLASLTLANLLMVASPFLLPQFSQNKHLLKWLRFSTFAALVLVWSYVLLIIACGSEKDLKVGCYVWAASFLLLCLSTMKVRNCKTELRKEQYV